MPMFKLLFIFILIAVGSTALPLTASPFTELAPLGTDFSLLHLTWSSFTWDEGNPLPQLQRLSAAAGIKIFWWNLEDGILNRTLPHPSLDENLVALIDSSLAPDVIVFGEYSERSFSEETLTALKKVYPYILFQKYNETKIDEGLLILSREKIQADFLGYLDWTPLSLATEKERDAYRKTWPSAGAMFMRPLLQLRINLNGREVSLIPVHLLDPWRAIRSKQGTVKMAEEVLWGKDTPLWFQIERLKAKLQARFGARLDTVPLFLFGDFNTPKAEVLKTAGYKLLTSDLCDIVIGNQRTFPAKSAVERKTFPAVEIDHGFINNLWSPAAAEVLPFQGSDHYALYFILKN